MKVFFAGVPGGGKMGNCKRERQLSKFFTLRLWSYYYLIENKDGMKKKKKIKLFLDSGAYSAKTQGIEINIDDYIKFIKKHENKLELYANLDNIDSAEKTWENQKYMEKQGLHPLPVYHYGEDVSFVERYVKNYDYIALGGLVGGSSTGLIKWLDNIWLSHLLDESGMPKVKVHGFGLTSLKLMLRYPWYSVDSTSWVMTGRMGSIYVPKYKKGRWIYDENSWKISVSSTSPDIKKKGQHISNISFEERKVILSYLEEKGYNLGKSCFKMEPQDYSLAENEKWSEKKPKDKNKKREVEIIIERGVSNCYKLRDEVNIQYFLDLEKSMPSWPWAFDMGKQSKSLF